MPYALPKQRGTRYEANFTAPSFTAGTGLASDAVSNTEPATKTTLIASTAFQTDWVQVVLDGNFLATTDSDSLVNIYVGAAASEQLLIPNLLAGWLEAGAAAATTDRRRYLFPLQIPVGTRISATHRSVRTAITMRCRIKLYGGGEGTHWAGTGVEAIGADTANSTGTYVTTGTTAEGTLTRLGASDGAATLAHDWGFVLPMMAGSSTTTTAGGILAGDLGTSGALIPGLDEFYYTDSTSETATEFTRGRFCFVPAGTILYMRLQYSNATANNKACIAYGVY